MLDIEADQRGRGIQCEADADGIDRDRRQPPADRQVAKHDHQGRRHEGAEQHAMRDAEHDQRRVVMDERDCERDQRVDQTGNPKHATQAEHGGEPCHRGRDENLRTNAGGREPGAFVKPQRERAAQIGEADRGQPAVEIGQKRTEQHRTDREQRLRSDAATRYRTAIGTVIFRHPSPHRRCGYWSQPTCPAAGARAAAGSCRVRSGPARAAPPW